MLCIWDANVVAHFKKVRKIYGIARRCSQYLSNSVSTSYVMYMELLMLMLISGEVGGYMGLLVGASVLTVCELLDLFIYNCFIKVRCSVGRSLCHIVCASCSTSLYITVLLR